MILRQFIQILYMLKHTAQFMIFIFIIFTWRGHTFDFISVYIASS